MCIVTPWSYNYIQFKFHEIPSIAEKVMAKDGKTSLKFWQSKGNNSSITDVNLMKLHMRNHTIVIYIQYKLHEIPSIGYLVMAEEKIIGIYVIKGQ